MSIDTSYALNGVELDDPAGRWFVDSSTEMPPIAGLRSSSILAAGFDGEIVSPNDPFDSAVMAMTVNVADVNPNTGNPSYAALQDNLDAIKGLFGSRHQVHVLSKTQGGVRRSTDVRVTAAVTPRQLDSRHVQIKYILDLPLPLWRDPNGTDWAGIETGSAYTQYIIPALTGATARCNHGHIRAEGPLSRLTLTDHATGLWLDIEQEVAAGDVLSVNLNDLTANVGDTNVSGSVDVGPGGFYLTPVDQLVRLGIQREGGLGLVFGVNLKRSFL